ncbi:MAG TPA: universal stress protein [Bryobacteraceae bacterium]|nr:universal stress protein [Bryobacteraceae bacterium]
MAATPFRSILVPVDFSDLSALALRYGSAMAERSAARLNLLYANAFTPPPYFTESHLDELQRQFRSSFLAAEQGLQRFADATLGGGAGAGLRVLEGPPADTILRYASDSGADLVAMGTHGRSGVNRWMMGSVAERVLRGSQIPVLTVRQAKPGGGPVDIKQILCPVNNSGAARKALAMAMNVASCFGARVTVMHVKEERPAGSIADLCSWIAENQRGACEIREMVRHGDAASEIVSAAAAADCDLAVIGAHHQAFFDSTVLGTTTVRVVRHAQCPVLTVMDRESAKTA